jgi:hypothetical protein
MEILASVRVRLHEGDQECAIELAATLLNEVRRVRERTVRGSRDEFCTRPNKAAASTVQGRNVGNREGGSSGDEDVSETTEPASCKCGKMCRRGASSFCSWARLYDSVVESKDGFIPIQDSLAPEDVLNLVTRQGGEMRTYICNIVTTVRVACIEGLIGRCPSSHQRDCVAAISSAISIDSTRILNSLRNLKRGKLDDSFRDMVSGWTATEWRGVVAAIGFVVPEADPSQTSKMLAVLDIMRTSPTSPVTQFIRMGPTNQCGFLRFLARFFGESFAPSFHKGCPWHKRRDVAEVFLQISEAERKGVFDLLQLLKSASSALEVYWAECTCRGCPACRASLRSCPTKIDSIPPPFHEGGGGNEKQQPCGTTGESLDLPSETASSAERHANEPALLSPLSAGSSSLGSVDAADSADTIDTTRSQSSSETGSAPESPKFAPALHDELPPIDSILRDIGELDLAGNAIGDGVADKSKRKRKRRKRGKKRTKNRGGTPSISSGDEEDPAKNVGWAPITDEEFMSMSVDGLLREIYDEMPRGLAE